MKIRAANSLLNREKRRSGARWQRTHEAGGIRRPSQPLDARETWGQVLKYQIWPFAALLTVV
jgi:hypothetical protein